LKSYFYDLNKSVLLKRMKANTLQYLENYQLINILDFFRFCISNVTFYHGSKFIYQILNGLYPDIFSPLVLFTTRIPKLKPFRMWLQRDRDIKIVSPSCVVGPLRRVNIFLLKGTVSRDQNFFEVFVCLNLYFLYVR
jgi:hypothetical protein